MSKCNQPFFIRMPELAEYSKKIAGESKIHRSVLPYLAPLANPPLAERLWKEDSHLQLKPYTPIPENLLEFYKRAHTFDLNGLADSTDEVITCRGTNPVTFRKHLCRISSDRTSMIDLPDLVFTVTRYILKVEIPEYISKESTVTAVDSAMTKASEIITRLILENSHAIPPRDANESTSPDAVLPIKIDWVPCRARDILTLNASVYILRYPLSYLECIDVILR